MKTIRKLGNRLGKKCLDILVGSVRAIRVGPKRIIRIDEVINSFREDLEDLTKEELDTIIYGKPAGAAGGGTFPSFGAPMIYPITIIATDLETGRTLRGTYYATDHQSTIIRRYKDYTSELSEVFRPRHRYPNFFYANKKEQLVQMIGEEIRIRFKGEDLPEYFVRHVLSLKQA